MAAAECPKDVLPIFFTGATQEIFGCVIDKDVSPEAPQKLILLTKIMDDFRNRAGVSDFSVCKPQMQVRNLIFLSYVTPFFLDNFIIADLYCFRYILLHHLLHELN